MEKKSAFLDRMSHLTPEQRALLQRRLGGQDAGAAQDRIERRQTADPSQLSSAQKRLWLVDQLNTGDTAYNIPGALRLQGLLNREALERSLNEIVKRHEALRTVFTEEAGEPRQQVLAFAWTPLAVTLLEDVPVEQRETEALRYVREEAQRPFDLRVGPLFRCFLLQFAPDDHVLIVNMHHIVSDGWSSDVLIRELGACYAAFADGQESPHAELPIQYADYAIWQQQRLQSTALEKSLRYWQEQLGGELSSLELPVDRPYPAIQTHRGASERFCIGRELTDRLMQVSQEQGSTLFMTLLAAYQTFLHRYTGQRDISVGTPMAGRSRKETEGLIGFFVNTLVMRTAWEGNPRFVDLLAQVRDVALGAFDHQEVPFEQLVDVLQPERDPRRNPLFQVMFALQQNQTRVTHEWPGVTLNLIEFDNPVAKFEMTLQLTQDESGLLGQWEYNTDLFDAETIRRMISHFQTLLSAIAVDPQQTIGHLPLLTEQERMQMLIEWNDTAASYPRESCIHELLVEQVQRTPDRVAVVYKEQSLTYRELHERSNRLARYLLQNGVLPGDLIGICVERSLEMVVGLAAILKAGGAYVPIDPTYPADRQAYMIEDANVRVMLTQQHLLDTLAEHSIHKIALDTDWAAIEAESCADLPEPNASAEAVAYINYTSGSTGKPKGVLVPHRGVVRLVKESTFVDYNEQAVFLQVASLSFDAATFEVWGSLLNGARLVLYPGPLPMLRELGDVIREQGITTSFLTGGLFNRMVDEHVEGLRGMRQLLVGGEALSIPHVRKALQTLSADGLTVINGYGPTENTTFSVTHQMDAVPEEWRSIPIGRPITNSQAYVLDEFLQPVPVGVTGELYLGGDGLALGYLNRADLTEERFLPHPFDSKPGARVYRTGDLVRYQADGLIEFLGRTDDQVKIRGFRIELGEIEHMLSSHPDVSQAVVIVREDEPGRKRLAAYLETTSNVPVSEWRRFLREHMPEYMIPTYFVTMDQLPLNRNGKVDRRALPAPVFFRTEAASEYTAPRTDVERGLAEIWSSILRVEQVGVHDNYFELGGDSIQSIQIVHRAGELGLRLTPKDLFQYKTIAELAEVAQTRADDMQIDQGPVSGAVAATPIQHWFLEQKLANPHHWNMSVLLAWNGDVQVDALGAAVRDLLVHHDALRMRVTEDEQGWQLYNEGVEALSEVPFAQFDLSDVAAQEREAAFVQQAGELQASLHLGNGPLLRVAYFAMGGEESDRLLVIAHHLVIDGVSWRILLQDLETAYAARANGEAPRLPHKTTSFRDWAERLSDYARSEAAQKELAYWRTLAERPFKRLPVDHPQGENTTAVVRTVRVALSAEETRQLLQEAPRAYNTQINDLLITALAQAFARTTSETSLWLNLEGHGREELIPNTDLTRTVGWFTSMYPVCVELAGAEGPGAAIKAVKEQLRAIPKRGIGYGLLRYLSEQALTMPYPELSFNYLGQLDQAADASSRLTLLDRASGPVHDPVNQRAHLLDISGSVSGGKLDLHWVYNADIHEEETIERLANAYADELRQLIAHCLAPEAGGYTPSDFPETRLTQEQLDALLERLPKQGIAVSNLEMLYELSPLQQGMLFHSLTDDESGVYVNQLSVELKGRFDGKAMERAWQHVLDKHAVLRTAFLWEGLDVPLQAVLDEVQMPTEFLDWRDADAEEQERQLQAFLAEEPKRALPLNAAPLMRVTLIQMDAETHWLVWTSHHILLDGWSLQVIISDLFSSYESQTQGIQLPHVSGRPYREFIAWLQQQEEQEAERFWKNRLAGFTTPTQLGVEKARSPLAAGDEQYVRREMRLSAEESRALLQVARERQVTLNTLIQTAWAVLLGRYSGESDVLFGVTVAGRPTNLPGADEMVGLFINTLPLRAALPPEQTVAAFLTRMQEEQAQTRDFEHVSLLKMQEWSDVARGIPLFETILVFENYPLSEDASDGLSELSIGRVIPTELTNYPLTLDVFPGDELMMRFTYDRQRYESDTIERVMIHYANLLRGILADQEQTLSALKLLSDCERTQMITEWNDTSVPYRDEAVLHELFEEQVLRTPDAVAAVYLDQELTYRELDSRANQLAHHLQRLGVGPDVPVGVCMERSLELVVALLGVLKAGGAYVPMDTEAPTDRLAQLLQESQAPVCLSQAHLMEKLPLDESVFVFLDRDAAEIAEHPVTKPASDVTPDHLVSIYYTSGSTGKPKGVANLHRGWVNRMLWNQKYHQMQPNETILQKTTLTFDDSAVEFFWPLMVGGRIALIEPEMHRDPNAILEAAIRHQAALIQFVPSVLNLFLQGITPEHQAKLTALRSVVSSGEALRPELVKLFQDRLPGRNLHNLCGSTEVSIDSTAYLCQSEDAAGEIVPIGWPIDNNRVYILDATLEPVPVGVIGELYYAGVGLARGYWNNQQITEAAFVPDPFHAGERMYKTGDRGYYRPNGSIQYLGRNDDQVKVRGVRVELGEIEVVLGQHPAVRNNVVVAHEFAPGDKRLVAYVVPQPGQEADGSEYRRFMKEKLPEYMVPSYFLQLDVIPLTPNGKVNRKALPKPDPALVEAGRDYVAPRDANEQVLAEVWGSVLGREQVGIHENFFDLGGDSILSIQIISRANQRGLSLTARDLFKHPTIAELASVVQRADAAPSADQGEVTGDVVLTPAQRWFFAQSYPEPHHWNLPLTLQLRRPLAEEILAAAIGDLMQHHDALRARFVHTADGWKQTYAAWDGEVPYVRIDLSGLTEAEQEAEFTEEAKKWQQSLDLSAGPLVRFVYFDFGADQPHRLFWVAHHLITDGLSWRILLEDLENSYRQREAGGAAVLPMKTTSFQNWAERLFARAQGNLVQGERSAWEQQAVPAAIPLDHQQGENTTASMRRHVVTLNGAKTEALLTGASRAYNTGINDLLLSALAGAFTRWTGEQSLLVELEGHGREELFEAVDLSRTVGWFTTNYPVLLTTEPGDIGGTIKRVKETLRAIPNRGIGYGLLRYMSEAGMQEAVQPQVLFNYLGQVDQSLAVSELFELSNADAGSAVADANLRSHWLEINAMVIGGELQFDWAYSVNLHEPETVEQLAAACIAELEALLEHCLTPGVQGYTPSDFPQARLDQAGLDRFLKGVNEAQVEQIYELSPMQEGLLFHSWISPESGVYVTQLTMELHGDLNRTILQNAFDATLQRHTLLRTGFHWQGEHKPLQVVGTAVSLPIYSLDWRDAAVAERAERLQAYAEADRKRGFDLTQAPLMRLTVLQVDEQVHQLVLTWHHLLLDGWSLPLLMKDVFSFYQAQHDELTTPVQPAVPYQAYIEWLQSRDMQAAEAFWTAQLAGFETPTVLRAERSKPLAQEEAPYAVQELLLPELTTNGLQEMAKQHQLTLNILVQGAWALLLSRYSGEQDVVFGSTVAGRPGDLGGVEEMVGLFINTLPVRAQAEPDLSVLAFLQRLQDQQVEAREYEYTPLIKVQEWSEIPRGAELFETIFVFENYPLDEAVERQVGGLEIAGMASAEMTSYPITAVALPGKHLTLKLMYDRKRFDDQTMVRLLDHFARLLESMMATPQAAVTNLPMLSAEEQATLAAWETASSDYPAHLCAHEVFAEQVRLYPQKVALRFEGQALTYEELDHRANQVAHWLRGRGAQPDRLVGICAERSLEMVVGLLGIMKSGGAYVPIDPKYPAERIAYMLEDAGIELILTQGHLRELLVRDGVELIGLDDEWEQVAQESTSAVESGTAPEHLAYVIYTSGSTGRPKGVQITHQGLVRLVKETNYVTVDPSDVFLQFASISFDASVFEIWGSLLNGSSLVIFPPHLPSLAELSETIRREQVSLLFLSTALFHQLADTDLSDLQGVRQWLTGGEALSGAHAKKVRAKLPHCRLVNLYGPTESTMLATYYELKDSDGSLSVPIGRPVANTTALVLDRHLQPVPPGVPGELCIGGPGLARAYLNRPELTEHVFVNHPETGMRLYRTGDSVCWNADGYLEYFGRIDQQVKIRGYRIELGEIEAMLVQHPDVLEAVVTAREETPGDKRLAAYVVSRTDELSARDVREFIKGRLPEYMVPSWIMLLESLPLNRSGKVDRAALPAPEVNLPGMGEHTAPRTEVERLMADVWSHVLRVEQVGVHDNFFDLGGDSILSIQIIHQLGQRGIRLRPQDLFTHKTISALAEVAEIGTQIVAEQGMVTGPVLLTPIQKWFFEQSFDEPHHWNLPVLIDVHGELEAEALSAALTDLMQHHDALRMRYLLTEHGVEQINEVWSEMELLTVLDLSEVSQAEREDAFAKAAGQAQQSLHITNGPLVRFLYARMGAEQPGRLLLVAHHLVVDGVSWRILLEDLEQAYTQRMKGDAVQLPAKTTSFQAWAERLTAYAESQELRQEEAFWLSISEGSAQPLPADHPQGANTLETARQITVELDAEQTKALLQDVPRAYNTQINDVLLTALAQAFTAWSGTESLLLTMEGHGREQVVDDVDLSRTVGWFTTSYPVSLRLPQANGVGAAIKAVKEQMRAIPNRGIGYGVLRELSKGSERAERLQALPRPEVSFNYLGQFDAVGEAGGLFSISSAGAGHPVGLRNRRSHVLDVNGGVTGGQMQFHFAYSAELHEAATIERLADSFLNALTELIAHCLSPEAGGYTPSDFPEARLTQGELDLLLERLKERSVPSSRIEQVYELSPTQQGMLFHSWLDPKSGVYLLRWDLKVKGNLRLDLLQQAWDQTLQRHTILRTAFDWENGQHPLQVVYKNVSMPIQVLDWRELSAEEQAARMTAFLEADLQNGLQLTEAPLMRQTVIRLADDEQRLVWTLHHLLLDGWSMPLVIQEVFTVYAALSEGQALSLSPQRPYRDYIAWLQRQDLDAAERFWREQLAGFQSPTPLVIERTSDESVTGEKNRQLSVTLPADLTRSLQALAKQQELTLNTVVQGAWALLLQRYSGEEDVVYGITVSGRPADLPGVEEMVGLFINTLPMRVQLNTEQSVLDYLQQLQGMQLRTRDFEFTPLMKVQEWSDVPRGSSLFETLFVFENFPAHEAAQQHATAGLQIEAVDADEVTNYPITFVAMPGEELTLQVLFDGHRVDEAAVQRLLGHMHTLLAGMAEQPQAKLASLPMLTAAEREHMLYAWNEEDKTFTSDLCAHEWFEAQAARRPDAVAVVCEDQSLTYGELNRRANQVAHALIRNGVTQEVLVGLCVDRSLEMIVGLLGIHKAGGAYVPLDPTYPPERLAFMLEDANVPVLLTQERWLDTLPAHQAQVICLDRDQTMLGEEPNHNPAGRVQPHNLAYVIYTSGSTGKPKGVLIPHSNITRLFAATEDWFQFDEHDVWTMFHSYAFDFSVWEMWGALLYGGKLVIVPYLTSRSPQAFHELLQQEGVTVLNQTPSAFRQLIAADQAYGEEAKLALRYVIFGGEALELQALKPWIDRHGDQTPHLINMYGITETTVHVTYRPIRLHDLEQGAGSVIGEPIPDLQIYLLDAALQPVPVGVIGEMYVGGAGVARGYLNRPDLTAERFIANPFGKAKGNLLYKTGDTARRLANGELEYFGRIDQQVKIRGFRIELGEIEAALLAHDLVNDAAVVVREDRPGDKRLVGYVVATQADEMAAIDLRGFLQENLPDYMIPAAFVTLDVLPLTANGKLDRRALPAPDFNLAAREIPFVAPRNETERILADVWANVLRVERVGIHDNFFELGGDSILSIQIIHRANQQGVHLTPKDLFEHRTIAELSQVAGSGQAAVTAEQGVVEGEVAVTPIQHWFFAQEQPQPQHWNMPLLLEVAEPLDQKALRLAISDLLQQHDALRMRFVQTESGWVQQNAGVSEEVPLYHLDLSAGTPEEQDQRFTEEASKHQAALDLQEALTRFVYFDLGAERPHRLLLAFHHLVVDGISWRIIAEDFEAFYRQRQSGTEPLLPLKTTSYRQWAEQLTQYADSPVLRQERDHWLQAHGAPVPAWKIDHAQGVNTEGSSETFTVTLDHEATDVLLKEAHRAYNTQINDLLLTAVARAYARWSGESDLFLNFEGHGREEIGELMDVSRTAGWFTSIYPVRLHAQPDGEISTALKGIKEQLRAIPNHGVGYGVLRYLTRDEELLQAIAVNGQPQISYNYLGQLDQASSASPLFSIATAEAGAAFSADNIRAHALDVNIWVADGRLQAHWTYSKHLNEQATIEQLAQAFLAELQAVTAHCLAPEAGGYTPSDVPEARLNQAQLDGFLAHLAERSVPRTDVEAMYALTPMQQGMLFHSMLAPESGMYIIQMNVELQGHLDSQLLEQALNLLLERHSILRTSFHYQGLEQPLQVVHRTASAEFTRHDWRGSTADEYSERLRAFLEADSKRGFQLDQAPLTRFAFLQISDDVQRLVWTSHHLLIDGWSMAIALQELFACYEAVCNGVELPRVTGRPYRDYVAWLQRQDEQAAECFWRKQLAGFPAATELPVQRTDALAAGEAPYADRTLRLDTALTEALQERAKQWQVTLNTVVQGAWALLLSRYSGTEDVVYGTTVSGRPADLTGVEEMVGLFINTLPVRAHTKQDITVTEFLQELQAGQVEARQFEYSPLLKVQEWSDVPRGQSLFDTLFIFENYPLDEAASDSMAGVEIRHVSSNELTNFPLTAVVFPGQELVIALTYDRARYADDTMDRLIGHLNRLLGELQARPEATLGELAILTDAERHEQLVTWNDTAHEYPRDLCVQELFERQAEQTPDSIAVMQGGVQWTYRELNERANRLAHHLRGQGVGPDTLVAVCQMRSPELVSALLAILKAGGAYVPIDPGYPQERIAYMLSDSEAMFVLTDSRTAGVLPERTTNLLVLDERAEAIASCPAHNPISGVTPSHLAYMIYTSGSTGQPKGAMIEHRGLTNYLSWGVNEYRVAEGHGAPLHSSIAFDLTVTGLYPPLLTGQTIELLPEPSDIEALARTLRTRPGFSLVKITPAHLQLLAQQLSDEELAGLAGTLVIGGEALHSEQLTRWHQKAPKTRLINEYGPTETVVGCTIHQATPEDQPGALPIGRPIANTQVYVLDERMQPVPAGVPGELYIGGDGVGRGYWKRPDLTAERFLPNPFSDSPNARLYKTGDLCRFRGDGTLDYLGRIDRQVKLRGYRIELGEIEAELLKQEEVRESAVLVREDVAGDKRLVAYVAPSETVAADWNPAVLRQRLMSGLPEYMVPTVYVALPELPLTSNGKIDLRALPQPETMRVATEREYVAPRNEMEQALADIWISVLRVDRVGVHDHFFELGGHSLLATQILSRIQSDLNVNVPLAALFDALTVEDLAKVIAGHQEQAAPTRQEPEMKKLARKSNRRR